MLSERPLGPDGQPIRPATTLQPDDVAAWVDGLFASAGHEARHAPDMDAAAAEGSSGPPAVIDVAGEPVDWSESGLPWEQLPQSYRDQVQADHLAKHAQARAERDRRHKGWEKRVRDLEKLPLDERSRVDIRVSPEFKAWVRGLADHMGASITVLICSSLVAQARSSGYHLAVPSRYNRRDDTPDVDSGPATGPTRIALETI